MFEAKCNDCQAVYSIEQDTIPTGFICLCGSEAFALKENTLVIA